MDVACPYARLRLVLVALACMPSLRIPSRPHATREHLQASMKQFRPPSVRPSPSAATRKSAASLARIDMAASGGAAAALRGLVVVLAVLSVSVWGAVATINVKETCSFTAHQELCEKGITQLVGLEGAPAPAPATSD